MELGGHSQEKYIKQLTNQYMTKEEQSVFFSNINKYLVQNDYDQGKLKKELAQFYNNFKSKYPSDGDELNDKKYALKYDSNHDNPNASITGFNSLQKFVDIEFVLIVRKFDDQLHKQIHQGKPFDRKNLQILRDFQDFKNEAIIQIQMQCLKEFEQLIPITHYDLSEELTKYLEDSRKEFDRFQKIHFDPICKLKQEFQKLPQRLCQSLKQFPGDIKQVFQFKQPSTSKVFPGFVENSDVIYPKKLLDNTQLQQQVNKNKKKLKPQNAEQKNDTVCFGDFLKELDTHNPKKTTRNRIFPQTESNTFEFAGLKFNKPPQGYRTYYDGLKIGQSFEQMICRKIYEQQITEGGIFVQKWDKCKSTFMQNMRNAIIDPVEIQKVYNEVLLQINQRVQ